MALDISTQAARQALIERCAGISTATWSDALDDLGLAGVISGLPMRSGTGRRCGFAVTVRGEVGKLGSHSLAEFGQAEMVAAAGPTQVLVVDAGGAEVSAMGGIVALSAHLRGIEAVVIDGACRDIDDIRTAGLWVASRHVTPRSGKRRTRLGHIGEPLDIGDVRICANDLVIGDSNGLVVVPFDRLEDMLAIAERVNASDRQLEGQVAAGRSLLDAAAP
ncbi:RraA family protein [Verticiella sediminum]|nr:RraA family protein [Verticiella sediminum]